MSSPPSSISEMQEREPSKSSLSSNPPLGSMDAQTIALINDLRLVLYDKSKYKRLLECRGLDAQRFLDFFQWLLDAPKLDSRFRRNLIAAMQRLSTKSGLYPMCYQLEDVRRDQYAIQAGGFADIYKGTLEDQAVCIKMIRLYQKDRIEDLLKNVMTEAILWGQLSHPNVVTFYGLYRFQQQIGLVLPWMENGDLTTWLKSNADAPRRNLAADVANGLAYLHENKIIHGDLKGSNVLIDNAGRALLIDFGISSVSSGITIIAWPSQSSVASRGGTVRWQAPEIVKPIGDEEVKNSLASDIYSFGCVCFQIFTGELPFANIQNDYTVVLLIQEGHRPQRPQSDSPPWNEWGLTDEMWMYIERCWYESPSKRPFAAEMAEYFTRLSSLPPPRLSSNIAARSAADFRRQLSKPLEMDTIDVITRTLRNSVIHVQPEKPLDTETPETCPNATELRHASPDVSSRQNNAFPPLGLLDVRDAMPHVGRSLQSLQNSYLLPSRSQSRPGQADPTSWSLNIIPAPQEANPSLLRDGIYPLLPYQISRESDFNFFHGDALPPHGWKLLMHPEGDPYFYHAEKKIVTGCCIWNPKKYTVLRGFIENIEDHNHSQCLELPQDTYLVLELSWEMGKWQCAVISQLGVNGDISPSHLQLYLEYQYWFNLDLFPDINSPTGDIYDLVANTIKDAYLQTIEDPKTMETLKEMADIVGDLRRHRPSLSDWCLGRFMWLLMKERFLNYYGKQGTLGRRKQTLVERLTSLFKRWLQGEAPRTVRDSFPGSDDAELLREALELARLY